MTVQVSARDWVGNVRDLPAETVRIDTVAPDSPAITKDTSSGNVISAIWTEGHGNDFDYFTVGTNGVATEQGAFVANVSQGGKDHTMAAFDQNIPDGSYLVVRAEDAAGNEASTLYLRNSTGEVTLDLTRNGLKEFDFTTIDLSGADANLTIKAEDILALTGTGKQLTVVGGGDDVVTLEGATLAAGGAPAGFKLYNLGSGTSVLIEDDVNVNYTGV